LVQIRWFVGLGSGTEPDQVQVEQAVVDAFNASHPGIRLALDVVDYALAEDTLASEIAAGSGPDVIGPVGIWGANPFRGQWLDLEPYVASSGFDLSRFNPALVSMYQTDEGLVSVPFGVYPAATFYLPALFDLAGLNDPPDDYGEPYIMPDGSPVEWSWETLGQVAKLITLDINYNNYTSPAFDRTRLITLGYSPVWQDHGNYIGSFFGAGAIVHGQAGAYSASIPEAWKTAWQWYYDGIWGSQFFIPSDYLSDSPALGSGNTFASGRIGMTVNNAWYLCCLQDLVDMGLSFELGALPSFQGSVHGRIDDESFRIWRGTGHPEAAFAALAYLVGSDGVGPLIGGTLGEPAYGALAALPDYQGTYFAENSTKYPNVSNWNILLAGLDYPDVPSADSYMPNFGAAWSRIQDFTDMMGSSPGLDLPAAIEQLESELTALIND
jgi:multiple sugar transport system substrate-binding protein